MKISQEKFEIFKNFVIKNKDLSGALMPILHEAQILFGAIPFEVQKYISKELDIPISEIYGVTTFYSQFTLVPNGKNTISVCLGTACYVRGAQDLVNHLSRKLNISVGETTKDGLYTLQTTRCVGACALAPVINYNNITSPKSTASQVDRDFEGMCKCEEGIKVVVTSSDRSKEFRVAEGGGL